MATPLFTRNTKLADLIATNHNLILMMPRFGIPLGFGNKTVGEICDTYDVPADFLLLVCNAYTFDNFLPDPEQLKQTDMSMLVPYLQASHRFYLADRLPHIGLHLHHIVEKVDPKYGKILTAFYADYQREVQDHFLCEEKEVFPILESIIGGGKPQSDESIGLFAESHGNIVDKLTDLTQIVYMYLPGNVLPEETIELIFDILQLSNDLEKHALIEEKILMPLILQQ